MEELRIIIEGSARHVHVTRETVEALFGPGYTLHNKRELSMPGEFLTEEKVRVEGPRGAIDNISILGPERPVTQIEVSLTDARVLGITPPVRESGDVAGSAPCRLVGPAGSVDLTEGVIVAKRHAHISQEDADAYGIENRSIVGLRIGGPRALVFEEVLARVSPKFATRVHLDYDELNAAGIGNNAEGIIVKRG